MKCRNCGHDNPEYSEVCENCAVSLRSEPQRDDDTPSWGFVDENKDIRFSFGGRNAAQNNNPADMNQNTDSDLDELERYKMFIDYEIEKRKGNNPPNPFTMENLWYR